MSEVMMGFYEAVIEWHDTDDEQPPETEVSPPVTMEAARAWLNERIIMNQVFEEQVFEEPGQVVEEWLVLPVPLDEQQRSTEARDGERWCYYWLRPSSQMALL